MLRLSALSAILAALNVYVCRELFRIEYLRHVGSIEAAFISIARYARDHWPDLSWFPIWYNGIPYQNSYPPLLHWTVAAVSALTGSSAALAYHATTAALYCLAPVALFWLCYRFSRSAGFSFAAGAFYSVVAPSAFLIGDIRRDLGSVLRGRRLEDLVAYGEGPHITGLALLPVAILLLDVAMNRRRPHWYVLAAIAFAATVLSNWLTAMALAIGVFAYLLARWPIRVRELAEPAAIGVLAYAFAAPWVPLSTIRVIQTNARTVEGDYSQYTHGLALRLLVLGIVIAAMKFGLERIRASRTMQFGAYVSVITAAVVLSYAYARIVFVPQPHRYHLEMEWGLAILIPFALKPLIERLPRGAIIAVACGAVLLAVPFAKGHRRYARYLLEPIDMTARTEYKTARWIDGHLGGERVMVPGATSYWFNAFTDTPQLGGGFDQGITNQSIRVATYVLYSSDGTGDRDTAISIAWLKALGVHAVATGGPNSGEYYKPFRNPHKFEGALEPLWREGDDVIYRVPQRSPELAYVMLPGDLAPRTPVNGIDVDPLGPYIAALDNPAYPVPVMRWTSQHSAHIEGPVQQGQIVSIQITHHPGWHATANGRDARVYTDPLGQVVIEPRCSGPCSIDIWYDGGVEMQAAWGLFWLAIAGSLAWIGIGNYRARRASR